VPPNHIMLADLPDRVRRFSEAYRQHDERRAREELRLLARDAALLANTHPFPWPHQGRSVEHRQAVALGSKPTSFIA
jgi:hypothetical protein